MIREHDIKWYLESPNRLKVMKPFTRGGFMVGHGFENSKILPNTMLDTGLTRLELKPISQDRYITEYRPSMHSIILNEAIPHIQVKLNGTPMPLGMMDMTQTASYQKLIHSAHVRNLTTNPLEFSLCETDKSDGTKKVFSDIKNEWTLRGMEWIKYQAVNICKQLGNVGVLFSFDKSTRKYSVQTFSYEDGYQIVPNYDEYGIEIACSLVYEIDGKTIIDTYDDKKHYRIRQNNNGEGENNWNIQEEVHGFPRCPLLHKRGKVAWEYAESPIEMFELMTNINNIALKRFGTFALVLVGDMDEASFKRDSSTLVINLSSDTTSGRQDAKTLEFPEPQTMNGYLDKLKEEISLYGSTSFITPKDISTSNSGGNGIALAMSNDFALATQGALDWQKFMQDMVYLHQVGLDLESNKTSYYSKLKAGAKIIPWSLETNNTKITNLQMEATYLSTQTIVEKCPDAAPDEIERIIKERGSLMSRNDKTLEGESEKAGNISRNKSNEIVDNEPKNE